MLRDLPPLNWLRAFEAAGRHESLTKAAEELNVTQAAISQHVKALETHTGIALFSRKGNQLQLTDSGRDLTTKLGSGFDILAEAMRELYRMHSPKNLTIRTGTLFSQLWLTPKLPYFTMHYPDLDIRISALDREADFEREDITMEIRYGDGKWMGVNATPLFRENFIPVCSPFFLQEANIKVPNDIATHPLLESENLTMGWQSWLNDYTEGLDPSGLRIVKCESDIFAIQGALTGEGIALAPKKLLSSYLQSGQLVAPLNASLHPKKQFWLTVPQNAQDNDNLTLFSEWLKEQAASN